MYAVYVSGLFIMAETGTIDDGQQRLTINVASQVPSQLAVNAIKQWEDSRRYMWKYLWRSIWAERRYSFLKHPGKPGLRDMVVVWSCAPP